MDKRMTAAFNSYNNSTAYELRNVYRSWSDKKQAAFENCRRACADHGGQGLRIISANTNIFTVGYIYTDDSNNTHFVYITPASTTDAVIPAWLVA